MFKGFIHSFRNQSGQALLIIVLVMVVALTVGLSVASRTLTSLRTTREQANSQKALSAAEAGVEQAIKNNASVMGSFSGGATNYNTTMVPVSGTQFLLNGGNRVQKDDPIYVWVTPYSSDPTKLWQNPWTGDLFIYWGDNSGASNNAALEVVVISGSKASPSVTRYAFDPDTTRTASNNFCSSTSCPNNSTLSSSPTVISGQTLNYKAKVHITNGLLVSVYPLYQGAFIGVTATTPLQPQGSVITSVGTVGSSGSNTVQRTVNVYQGYPELPVELFPYILFSP